MLDLNKAHLSRRVALVVNTAGAPPPDRSAEETLRELINDLGFSPKVLARHFGVEQSSISRWRSGESAPSARSKKKILALRDRLDREGVEFVKTKLEKALSRKTGISPEEIEALALTIYLGMQRHAKEQREGILSLALRLVQGITRRVLSIVRSSEE